MRVVSARHNCTSMSNARSCCMAVVSNSPVDEGSYNPAATGDVVVSRASVRGG